MNRPLATLPSPATQPYLGMRLGGQLFGLPVALVREVMRPQPIAPIPLAPESVAGVMQVRGQIATAIDLRRYLGLPPATNATQLMHVMIVWEGERYVLIVDAVEDMLPVAMEECTKLPGHTDPLWRQASAGVVPLETELLILLDIAHVIDGLATAP